MGYVGCWRSILALQCVRGTTVLDSVCPSPSVMERCNGFFFGFFLHVGSRYNNNKVLTAADNECSPDGTGERTGYWLLKIS